MVESTLTWSSASDWDSAQAESGVVHEATTDTDHTNAADLKKGYSVASPIVSNGLVGYWPMHENTGGSARDFAGNNDITLNGVTQGATGILGTSALDFDGSGDYGTASYTRTNSISCCCWVLADSTSSSADRIISQWNGSGWILDVSGPNLRWYIDGGNDNNVQSSRTFPTGSWEFICGTFDANNEAVLYENGSQAASTTVNYSLGSSGTTGLGFGEDFEAADRDNAEWWDGKLAEVRVYNRALSASEVQQLYDIIAQPSTLTTAEKIS